MLRFTLISIFVFNSLAISAQRIIPRFENLGVNDGLPHSSVYGIRQDRSGFMWFSSPDGLARYDGGKLQTFRYKAKNDTDIVNNYIRGSFFEDRKGNIWYSNESGIFKWNVLTENIEKTVSFSKNEFGASGFQCMYMDSNDVLLILNVIKGVFAFNTVTQSLKLYPFPYRIDYSQVMFTEASADDRGNIWLRLFGKDKPRIFFFRQDDA